MPYHQASPLTSKPTRLCPKPWPSDVLCELIRQEVHDGCDDADDEGRAPTIHAVQLELLGIAAKNANQRNALCCSAENVRTKLHRHDSIPVLYQSNKRHKDIKVFIEENMSGITIVSYSLLLHVCADDNDTMGSRVMRYIIYPPDNSPDIKAHYI